MANHSEIYMTLITLAEYEKDRKKTVRRIKRPFHISKKQTIRHTRNGLPYQPAYINLHKKGKNTYRRFSTHYAKHEEIISHIKNKDFLKAFGGFNPRSISHADDGTKVVYDV